jgi:DNA-binding PadR family transcriptional regulator
MANSEENEPMKRPAQKAFRLSDEGRSLLAALAQRLGVTETAVVELAIREKAKQEGLRNGVEDREAVRV